MLTGTCGRVTPAAVKQRGDGGGGEEVFGIREHCLPACHSGTLDHGN